MKFLVKYFLVMIVIGMLLGLINKFARQAPAFPVDSLSKQRLQNGPFDVEFFKMTFIDESRPTQPNHDYQGSDHRALQTNIWLPRPSKNDNDNGSSHNSSTRKHPLIIYSHGFSSNNRAAKVTNAHLASHGYIVMAPNFPLTHTFAPGGPLAVDVAQQPADVSFVIDQALELNLRSDHFLAGKVDGERIGVMGISMGGLTSTIAALHPLNHDQRIDVAVSIAGPSSYFESEFFEPVQLPFMMVAGEIDVIIPFETNARPVIEKVPHSTLVTLAGGSHLGFADIAAPLRWLKNPDIVGCYFVETNLADEGPDDPRWQNLFGPSELGINYQPPNDLCIHDSLQPAMNVLQQTALTRLVVRAFLDSHLAGDAQQRRAASDYLYSTIANEAPEITVQKHSSAIQTALE